MPSRIVVALAVAIALLAAPADAAASAASDSTEATVGSLLAKLRRGIDDHNRALETLLVQRSAPAAMSADMALLARLRSIPGVRPKTLKLIENYQLRGAVERGASNVDTIRHFYAMLRERLAKEERDRLTASAMTKLLQARGQSVTFAHPGS